MPDLNTYDYAPGTAAPQNELQAIGIPNPPPPAAAAGQTTDDAQKQSWSSRMYHGIINALGGQYDTQYTPTPNGVIQQQVAQTPGQQWKRIISGAITGFGAGASAAAQGGRGATMAGVGAGVQAGYQQRMAQDKQQQDLASKQFDQQQQAAMNNANRSLIASKIARDTWDLSAAKKQAYESDLTNEANLMKIYNDAKDDGAIDYGVKPTFQDGIEAFNNDPTMHDKHAQGQLIPMAHVNAGGVIDGVHVIWVPKTWQDRKATTDFTFQNLTGYDEKGNPKYEPMTVGASTNSTNGDVQNAKLANASRQLEFHKAEVQNKATETETGIKEQLAPAQRAQAFAQAGKDQAEAALSRYNLDFLKQHGELPGKESSKENQELYYGPGGSTGFNSWYEKRVAPVQDIENTYQVAKTAYDEHASGKDKTGAPGMILFGQHLANTFGSSKAKLNKQMIEDHFGARGLTDDVRVTFQKLTNGEKLSDNQYNEFMRFIADNRNTRWQGVTREATAQHRPMELIGLPNDLAQQYLAPAGAAGTTGTTGAARPGLPAWARPVTGTAGAAGAAGTTGAQNTHVIPTNFPVSAAAPAGAVKKNKGSDGKEYWLDKNGIPVALTGK